MRIHIIGDITHEAFVDFDTALCTAEEANEEVEVILSSDGGNAQIALAFFDRIQSADVTVTIVGTGLVASAAVLILAAGHKRQITKNAWVMVHEESLSDLSGDVTAIEREAKQLRSYENQWTALLASVTRTSAEQWTHLHKAEVHIPALQCLAYGLIEEII